MTIRGTYLLLVSIYIHGATPSVSWMESWVIYRGYVTWVLRVVRQHISSSPLLLWPCPSGIVRLAGGMHAHECPSVTLESKLTSVNNTALEGQFGGFCICCTSPGDEAPFSALSTVSFSFHGTILPIGPSASFYLDVCSAYDYERSLTYRGCSRM